MSLGTPPKQFPGLQAVVFHPAVAFPFARSPVGSFCHWGGGGLAKFNDGIWWSLFFPFFPTCQVRVVRFYVSCLLLSSSPLLLLLLNRDPRRTVFSVGPQPRPSTPSVPCRTSTTTIPAQCSLPDLNHDHPRPVFPAGPQPRVSTPSVPCRTSCRKIWDKECAEES